jgi:hypothetical protein
VFLLFPALLDPMLLKHSPLMCPLCPALYKDIPVCFASITPRLRAYPLRVVAGLSNGLCVCLGASNSVLMLP